MATFLGRPMELVGDGAAGIVGSEAAGEAAGRPGGEAVDGAGCEATGVVGGVGRCRDTCNKGFGVGS